MYYAVFLFQQAGIHDTQASLLANGIQGAVLNVVTWVNMWYIDTWGRRRPMVIGAIGMGISMMLIGVIMATKGKLRSLDIYIVPIHAKIPCLQAILSMTLSR
jgi:MFS family permease